MGSTEDLLEPIGCRSDTHYYYEYLRRAVTPYNTEVRRWEEKDVWKSFRSSGIFTGAYDYKTGELNDRVWIRDPPKYRLGDILKREDFLEYVRTSIEAGREFWAYYNGKDITNKILNVVERTSNKDDIQNHSQR